MFIGYLKGVQKVAGWCLSLEGVSGQAELYLRMEFDSGVGPTCCTFIRTSNPFYGLMASSFKQIVIIINNTLK